MQRRLKDADVKHAGPETHRRVELLSLAIQEASGRLRAAALRSEDWAPYQVVIALTESLSWIRALDGSWVGIVDFSISDSHGGHVTRATGVPIPAEALTELVMPPRR